MVLFCKSRSSEKLQIWWNIMWYKDMRLQMILEFVLSGKATDTKMSTSFFSHNHVSKITLVTWSERQEVKVQLVLHSFKRNHIYFADVTEMNSVWASTTTDPQPCVTFCWNLHHMRITWWWMEIFSWKVIFWNLLEQAQFATLVPWKPK